MFSEKERAYLKTQRLARIATVSKDTQPDVAPVSFEFDGEHFYIGSLQMEKTLKYRNVQANPRVALVIDDLETTDPWAPRGIKIHGRAQVVDRPGQFGAGLYIRVTPERYWSWGVEAPTFQDGKPAMKRVRV